ncbi:MAG: two-component system, sensor protein [Amnibacterium sp.]|nr:two-component system, sensor protein [Amnibacterium sp.]
MTMRSEEPALLDPTAAEARNFVSPIGTRRVEITLAVAMSLFGLLFSVQSLPALIAQAGTMNSALGHAIVVLVYGTILIAGLAAVLRQWTTQIFLTAAAAYLVALALWVPSLHGAFPAGEIPWIIQLSTVPSGFMIVGRREWITPAIYTAVIGVAIGLLRSSMPGGSVDPARALLDAVYAVALNLGLLILTVAVRLAARQVDQAQTNALQRYAAAQIDQAMESERVRTDALVHDSVLTTFLSAAAAQTAEAKDLAARMARNAMGHLSRATVAADTGPHVTLGELVPRIQEDALAVVDRFEVRSEALDGRSVPTGVAEALVSATVQAMTNSVKHAGGPELTRTVVLRGTTAGGVQSIISDNGAGFDPALAPSERLGVRVSILERIRLVGGDADIRTAPGLGTTIVLSWPAAAREASEPVDITALALG